MIVNIRHKVSYKYTNGVFLEPHYIRLTPFSDTCCKLIKQEIKVYPDPQLIYPILELSGCTSYLASFKDTTDIFEIEHFSQVELSKKNPFNFIILPSEFSKLPFPKGVQDSPDLKSYLNRNVWSDEVGISAYEELYKTTDDTLSFLINLVADINKNIPYLDRENGNPFDPEITMKQGGSCRDKTLLFIDICRSLNIPARYVSGYPISLESKENKIDSGYHAWAEVFIPGAGWMGFDPTIGITCYGYHVKLAASPYYEETMPASGSYRGQANSKIEYGVDFWY